MRVAFLKLPLDFYDSPPVLTLLGLFGDVAVSAWLRLEIYAAKFYRSGEFFGLTTERLAAFARCPESYIDEFLALGLLEQRGGAISIVGWKEDQDYIANFDQVSETKRRAALMRWRAEQRPKPTDAGAAAAQSKPLPKGPKRPRATQWPSDFALDEELTKFAESRGLDAAGEFQHFRDHCIGAGKSYASWTAGFREWCRRSVTFRSNGGGRYANGTKMSAIEVQKARVAELAAQK